MASPQRLSSSLVSSLDSSVLPAWNFTCKTEAIDINGAMKIMTSACYQQKTKPITKPVNMAAPPSTYGPILSELTPLIIAVSEAIDEVSTPAEFSLRSNQPIFFIKIFS